MDDLPMFHQHSRALQREFGTVALADRIVERMASSTFDDAHRAFIEGVSMFFLATADSEGRPDCSYKGGLPGFVRVLDSSTLAFPHYDGNGMFKSLGNMLANPSVGLLFIDFETPRRLRVNGVASIDRADPLLGSFPGAQLLVRVAPTAVFLNCPRYVHTMAVSEHSVYAPRNDYTPPEPEWKQRPEFSDVVPTSPCNSE